MQTNPYHPQPSDSVPEQREGNAEILSFAVAWLMVFGFNLILPLMIAIPITDQSGRIGMTVAISLFLLVGWYIGYRNPRNGMRLVVGGTIVAISQLFPVLHIVSGMDLLPLDISSLPLYVVSTSQCCLSGLWLVHFSESWSSRILVPTVIVGLLSGLRWAADGPTLPADVLWLSAYALDGLVPLAGVTCCALMLNRTTKPAKIRSQSSLRFSIADLIFVTAMCAIGILAVMLSPPSLTDYQYMDGGLLTAALSGIRANPLWGVYALAPSLTAVLVSVALLLHRHALAHPQCCKQLVDSCDEPSRAPKYGLRVSTLHYAGDTTSINQLLQKLGGCPDATLTVSFRKIDHPCDWRIVHVVSSNKFSVVVNLSSKRIRLEELVIPAAEGPKLKR